jgi:hypothetical protein
MAWPWTKKWIQTQTQTRTQKQTWTQTQKGLLSNFDPVSRGNLHTVSSSNSHAARVLIHLIGMLVENCGNKLSSTAKQTYNSTPTSSMTIGGRYIGFIPADVSTRCSLRQKSKFLFYCTSFCQRTKVINNLK